MAAGCDQMSSDFSWTCELLAGGNGISDSSHGCLGKKKAQARKALRLRQVMISSKRNMAPASMATAPN